MNPRPAPARRAAARSLPPAALCLLAILPAALAGCFSQAEPADLAVASYPAAFVAEGLAGDDLTVADLAGGAALHDFEPSARDLDQLRKADHLVLWDEGLESWAHRAEGSLGRSAPAVVEITRLPPGEDYAEQDEDAEEEEDDGHGLDHDPHTWLDPLAMRESVAALADYLAAAYPEHADAVGARAERMQESLAALDRFFRAGLEGCAHDTIVTNHDAYAYLGRRYGFTIVSLHGIEPGSEPSPQTVDHAIRTIRDLSLPVLFIEEGTGPATLRAIRDETGVTLRILHTLETRPAGGDYLTAQRENLDALRAAMECP